MASIGAAIIVKDSYGTLTGAINSVKSVCDQIVTVDTGSRDETPALCSRLGVELHFFNWTGSFSEARNFALKFMRTDWILIIDADEELDSVSFIQNINLLEQQNIGGINVLIKNYLSKEKNTHQSIHRYTRLFRRNENIYFEGRIHEQVSPSIEAAGMEIMESDIIIHHYGYTEVSQEKLTRNKELLQEELTGKPDDAWLIYHLADTEFSLGNLDRAKQLLETVLNSTALSHEQNEMVRLRLAQLALSKDNYTEIELLLNFKCQGTQNEGFRLYILAAALMMQKRFREALDIYNSPEIKLSGLVDQNKVEDAKRALGGIAGI